MDGVVSDMQSLLQVVGKWMNGRIRERSRDAQTVEDVLRIVEDETRSLSPGIHLFSGLESQHQQLVFFRTHFNLLEPVKIVLGTTRKAKGCGSKRRLIEKGEVMVYVPILSSLQSLLNNDSILTMVERGSQGPRDNFQDYHDGQHFLTHPLFSSGTPALQILLYYDDVECCNPLGSSRTKHKLGFFYYQLANIHSQYRSKLKMIQLLAICRVKLIKKYSMNCILTPIVEDLKKLERGHEFLVGRQTKQVSGSLALISADNLASNALGGFKETASANRNCRQCMGSKEDNAVMFVEDVSQLRNHTQHCSEIEDDNSLSVEYGINYRTKLMELQYFDVCSGALLPDVMHDILEGVLQYEMKLLLSHCLHQKYFKVSHLNEMIEGMELGFMEGDRPAPIAKKTIHATDSNLLKQKASQVWTLGRLLPLMFGSHVREGDCNFLLMVQITMYLMAPTISSDEVACLQVMIEKHHTSFSELYPNSSIIPKMHYITHMPRLILKFCPLVKHWTMRYEARHNYFKKLAQNLGNYINLSWTLAMRHQFLQCHYQQDSDMITDDSVEIGPGDVVSSRDLPLELQDTECYRARWVKLRGVLIKKPAAVLTGVSNDNPQFARLEDIFITNCNRVVLHTKMFCVDTFVHHYQAYKVSLTPVSKLIHPESLTSLQLFYVHKLGTTTELVIVTKHHICGTLEGCP